MKKLLLIIICISAAILVSYFAANTIAKISIEKKVATETGLQLKIKSFNIDLVKSLVQVEGFRLFNPQGYQDSIMLDIPKILIDYSLPAVLEGRIHLK